MELIIKLAVILITIQTGFCQPDSSSVHLRAGLMGRWQTGNFKQLSLLPNGEFTWTGRKADLRITANYHYLQVADSPVINDLWVNMLYRLRPENKYFVALITNAGFAKSYRFERSILTGPGLGVNMLPSGSRSKLTAYLFAGYLNFKFETGTEVRDPGFGSLLLGAFPLTPELQLTWELSTYHAIPSPSFWGGGNMIRLAWQVMPSLAFTATHQSYFNRQAPEGIANTNTQFLFGFQFSNIHK